MMKSRWRRIYKLGIRCPICGKPDWCMVSDTWVCCARTPSSRRLGNAGWLHPWPDVKTPPIINGEQPETDEKPAILNVIDVYSYFSRYTTTERLEWHAKNLGVSRLSLELLGTLCNKAGDSLIFPMRSGRSLEIIGFRVRKFDGSKRSIKGSKEGLFVVPTIRPPLETLIIVEGPTDTVAGLHLDLPVIGRPSCNCGNDHILAIVKRLRPTTVVIIADNDEPGIEGAKNTASQLRVPCQIAILPCKDLREFVQKGGTKKDLLRIIYNAPFVNTHNFVRKVIRSINEQPDWLEAYVSSTE